MRIDSFKKLREMATAMAEVIHCGNQILIKEDSHYNTDIIVDIKISKVASGPIRILFKGSQTPSWIWPEDEFAGNQYCYNEYKTIKRRWDKALKISGKVFGEKHAR